MIQPLDEAQRRTIAAARQTYPQKSIRQQVGETMVALAAEGADFLVLTADLMHATGMAPFGERFPDRVINVGIAEQNLAGVASGLALCGKLPFVSCYAAFTSLRGVEQIKVDAAYNGAKVIFAAQSSGLSYGVGGPTHQSFEDVAIMRAIPNTVVLTPSDAIEVDACLRAALAYDVDAPIYIRLGRGPEYLFTEAGTRFEIGCAVQLREGRDVAIVANGSMVFEALLAADFLKTIGISATVLNVHTVKPIDSVAVRTAAANCSAMVVVEEHSVHGGLGSAVLETISECLNPTCRLLGIRDVFPPVGPTHDLRDHLGLSAHVIAAHALDLIREL